MMTRKEKMFALRADQAVHYNCAQSIVIPCAGEMGLAEDKAGALAQNFGGGMGCGGACGAVIGTLMAMGGMGLPMEERTAFLRYFREQNGALTCAELVKAAVEQGEERKAHCDKMIESCMDYLAQLTGRE